MADAEDLARRATPILERLVGFDTTSHLSNLALIDWVEAYLAGHGIASQRIGSDDGAKANLLAPWVRRWKAASCSPATPTWCRSPARPGPAIRSPWWSAAEGCSAAARAT
jgi:hypothetical protein